MNFSKAQKTKALNTSNSSAFQKSTGKTQCGFFNGSAITPDPSVEAINLADGERNFPIWEAE